MKDFYKIVDAMTKQAAKKIGNLRLYQLSNFEPEPLASFLVIQGQTVESFVSYDEFNTFIGHGVAAGGGYDKVSLAIINSIKNSIEVAAKCDELGRIYSDIEVFNHKFLKNAGAGSSFEAIARAAKYRFERVL